jgi:hypothetical protein
MMARNPQPKKPEESAVELAVAALDGNPSPLDMDMRAIDPDPTSLDLALPGKPDDRRAAETGADWRQSKKTVRDRKKMPPASPR